MNIQPEHYYALDVPKLSTGTIVAGVLGALAVGAGVTWYLASYRPQHALQRGDMLSLQGSKVGHLSHVVAFGTVEQHHGRSYQYQADGIWREVIAPAGAPSGSTGPGAPSPPAPAQPMPTQAAPSGAGALGAVQGVASTVSSLSNAFGGSGGSSSFGSVASAMNTASAGGGLGSAGDVFGSMGGV